LAFRTIGLSSADNWVWEREFVELLMQINPEVEAEAEYLFQFQALPSLALDRSYANFLEALICNFKIGDLQIYGSLAIY
jgi:hypothetical protein